MIKCMPPQGTQGRGVNGDSWQDPWRMLGLDTQFETPQGTVWLNLALRRLLSLTVQPVHWASLASCSSGWRCCTKVAHVNDYVCHAGANLFSASHHGMRPIRSGPACNIKRSVKKFQTLNYSNLLVEWLGCGTPLCRKHWMPFPLHTAFLKKKNIDVTENEGSY